MRKTVIDFIADNSLFCKEDRLLVGVSGGADSVALLHILYASGYDCVVAHCNFHLRGNDSDRDEEFVEKLARSYGFPFVKADFDTVAVASSMKVSVEMAARDLRYDWFRKEKQHLGCSCVVVAHHKDDVVETFLINMTRGSGLHGLSGIKPKSGDVVRPFLCVSRTEILGYLSENKLQHVEDYTNAESVYVRNKFRNDIIPMLEQVNASFKNTLIQTISNIADAEKFVNEKVDCFREMECVADNDVLKIPVSKILESVAGKFLLFELLYKFNFSANTISDIYNSLSSISGKTFYTKGNTYKAIKDRDFVVVAPFVENDADESYYIDEGVKEISSPLSLTFSLIDISDFDLIKSSSVCYVDIDKLKFPLELRRWKKGDVFFPFGMKKKKKVSDFFIDNKFTILDKENAWLLCSGGEVVWIVGHRADNRYRIDDNTKKILEIDVKMPR